MPKFRMILVLTVFALDSLVSVGLRADGTKFWSTESRNDFFAGKPDGVSIRDDGILTLAPQLSLLVDTGQPFIWNMALDSSGCVYAGTGHEGRVLKITPDGDTTTVFDAEQLEIMGLASDNRGNLFVGTSPDGAVYRVPARGGAANIFFDPPEKYIWKVISGPDNYLYVAVGSKGKIYRVSQDGKNKVILDTDQDHILSMAFDLKGNLIAGSSGGALVYQIAPDGEVSIIFDSPLQDIRSIVVDRDNCIYAAAFDIKSGIDQMKTLIPKLEGATGAPGKPGSKQESPQTQEQPQTIFKPSAQVKPTIANSEIYAFDRDRYVLRLWRGSGEAVMALGTTRDNRVIFASSESDNEKVNLYAVNQLGELSLLSGFEEAQVTGFLRDPIRDCLYLCTSNLGKIFVIQEGFKDQGVYTSKVLDADLTSQWGRITWEGQASPGTDIFFRTRAGNTSTPDTTWSPWSAPYHSRAGENISSPPRKYFQWEATLTTRDTKTTPELGKVVVSYLRRNRPPRISPIRILPAGVYIKPSPKLQDSNPASEEEYPDEVQEILSGGLSRATENPFQGKKEYGKGMRMAGWNAQDANGDEIRYNVYFRGVDELVWRTLALNIEDNFYTWDTRSMADGKYVLKITAHDSLENTAQRALTSERASSPFVIDNTAPEIEKLNVQAKDRSTIEVSFEASDMASQIEKAEISLDAGDWKMVSPADSIADSAQERFGISFDKLPAGEHTISVRVFDSLYNIATASRTVTLK